MYKAIETRFHGPSNVRGARISARAPDNPTVFFDYPHDLNHSQRHGWAAKEYAKLQNWPGLYIAGYMRGSGFVYVNLGSNFSRAWVDKYICEIEGDDWFYLENSR